MWQSCALSLLVFTGASQFALVGVIAAGGAPVLAAVSGLLLGTRNTLYGLKVAPMLGWRGWRRAAAAHLLIDESHGDDASPATTREDARVGFLSTGLSIFVLWNLATLARRLGGRLPRRPAHLWPRCGGGRRVPGPALAPAGQHRNRWPRCSAAAVALCVVPLTPSGRPVLAASVVAVGMALMARETESSEAP